MKARGVVKPPCNQKNYVYKNNENRKPKKPVFKILTVRTAIKEPRLAQRRG
jgi:hypothetical protein